MWLLRLLWCWILGISIASAESQPKHLDTRFEAFKQQQQQHDAQLMTGQALTSQPSPRAASTSATTKATAGLAKVSINRADAVTLSQQLIGIGPKKAEAIVAYRLVHGLFQRVDDLALVKGIGSATLEKNRQKIILD